MSTYVPVAVTIFDFLFQRLSLIQVLFVRSECDEGPQSMCLSASSTTMETIKFQHRWTIDQFAVQQELSQVGESIESRLLSVFSN